MVSSNKERPDAIIRECLAQLLSEFSYIRMNKNQLYSKNFPIVKLYSVFETLDYFILELEMMQKDNLHSVLLKNGIFTELQTKNIILQLLDALKIYDQVGIVHRDIKLKNITVSSDNNGSSDSFEANVNNISIKLADFGLSGFVGHDKSLTGRCGTPGYIAPEILNLEWANKRYNKNVDMFSIGVVAYTLLCGYEPFADETVKQTIVKNSALHFGFDDISWSVISSEAKDWIRRTMTNKQETRMSEQQARHHIWLSSRFK